MTRHDLKRDETLLLAAHGFFRHDEITERRMTRVPEVVTVFQRVREAIAHGNVPLADLRDAPDLLEALVQFVGGPLLYLDDSVEAEDVPESFATLRQAAVVVLTEVCRKAGENEESREGGALFELLSKFGLLSAILRSTSTAGSKLGDTHRDALLECLMALGSSEGGQNAMLQRYIHREMLNRLRSPDYSGMKFAPVRSTFAGVLQQTAVNHPRELSDSESLSGCVRALHIDTEPTVRRRVADVLLSVTEASSDILAQSSGDFFRLPLLHAPLGSDVGEAIVSSLEKFVRMSQAALESPSGAVHPETEDAESEAAVTVLKLLFALMHRTVSSWEEGDTRSSKPMDVLPGHTSLIYNEMKVKQSLPTAGQPTIFHHITREKGERTLMAIVAMCLKTPKNASPAKSDVLEIAANCLRYLVQFAPASLAVGGLLVGNSTAFNDLIEANILGAPPGVRENIAVTTALVLCQSPSYRLRMRKGGPALQGALESALSMTPLEYVHGDIVDASGTVLNDLTDVEWTQGDKVFAASVKELFDRQEARFRGSAAGTEANEMKQRHPTNKNDTTVLQLRLKFAFILLEYAVFHTFQQDTEEEIPLLLGAKVNVPSTTATPPPAPSSFNRFSPAPSSVSVSRPSPVPSTQNSLPPPRLTVTGAPSTAVQGPGGYLELLQKASGGANGAVSVTRPIPAAAASGGSVSVGGVRPRPVGEDAQGIAAARIASGSATTTTVGVGRTGVQAAAPLTTSALSALGGRSGSGIRPRFAGAQ